MPKDDKYYSYFVRPAPPYRSGDLRREREIGDWGRASEHIGRQWEELGLSRLELLLDAPAGRNPWARSRHRPLKTVPLMSDEILQNSLLPLGLPSPDVLILLQGPEGIALQPIDFKWDLEFAGHEQIRAATISALLDRDPGVFQAALGKAAGQPISGAAYFDGLLFAPDRHANRLYLASESNRRRECPVEPDEVIFADVSAREFFSPLPSWDMAERLAALDRCDRFLEQLEGAERYYRLGAGLLGAIARLRASIFVADPPGLDGSAALAWLEDNHLIVRSNSSGIVQWVDQQMRQRSVRVARLKQLTRSPFRPADVEKLMAKTGSRLLEGRDDGVRDLCRRIGVEHRDALVKAGADLVRLGSSEEVALSRLEDELPKFRAATRAAAERLIAASVASRA